VPTYNESENIKILCKKIFRIKKVDLLIIDDNSPDGTYKIIEKLKLKYKNLFLLKRKKKLGFGSAIREGMNYALKKKYNALITLDADLSHNPKEIPLFIKNLRSYDFITGSRYIKGGGSDYVGYRDMVSRVANKLCRFFLNISDGYSSQIEFFFYIYKSGLNCNEIPIKFRQRFKGNSKIPRLEVLYSALKLIELFIKRFFIKKK